MIKRFDCGTHFDGGVIIDSEDGEFVEYKDYAELEARCAALAAEVQSVKAMNDCLSEELRGYESDGAFEGPKMHLVWWKTETPATNAFLAEVRASSKADGVQEYADSFRHAASKHRKLYGESIRVKALLHEAGKADEFAEQLRQEAK